MGLDMYVRRVDKWDKKTLSNFVSSVIKSNAYSVNGNSVEFNIDNYLKQYPTTGIPYGITDELCYWTKHPDLHGWMKTLFYDKGGSSDSDFNHDVVFLFEEDVEKLREDIVNNNLPHTTGFFFGQSYDDKKQKKSDLEMVELMKNSLSKDELIYYISSW